MKTAIAIVVILVIIFLLVITYACCRAASLADDISEQWENEWLARQIPRGERK